MPGDVGVFTHHLCHPFVRLGLLLGALPLKLGQQLLPHGRVHLLQVIHPEPLPGLHQDPLGVNPRGGLLSQPWADELGGGGGVGDGLAGCARPGLGGGKGGSCLSLWTG